METCQKYLVKPSVSDYNQINVVDIFMYISGSDNQSIIVSGWKWSRKTVNAKYLACVSGSSTTTFNEENKSFGIKSNIRGMCKWVNYYALTCSVFFTKKYMYFTNKVHLWYIKSWTHVFQKEWEENILKYVDKHYCGLTKYSFDQTKGSNLSKYIFSCWWNCRKIMLPSKYCWKPLNEESNYRIINLCFQKTFGGRGIKRWCRITVGKIWKRLKNHGRWKIENTLLITFQSCHYRQLDTYIKVFLLFQKHGSAVISTSYLQTVFKSWTSLITS